MAFAIRHSWLCASHFFTRVNRNALISIFFLLSGSVPSCISTVFDMDLLLYEGKKKEFPTWHVGLGRKVATRKPGGKSCNDKLCDMRFGAVAVAVAEVIRKLHFYVDQRVCSYATIHSFHPYARQVRYNANEISFVYLM